MSRRLQDLRVEVTVRVDGGRPGYHNFRGEDETRATESIDEFAARVAESIVRRMRDQVKP